jgi:hypothetical protein
MNGVAQQGMVGRYLVGLRTVRVLLAPFSTVAAVCAAPRPAIALGCSIQPTPMLAGRAQDGLGSVSWASASACITVGSYVDPTGRRMPRAESWMGRSGRCRRHRASPLTRAWAASRARLPQPSAATSTARARPSCGRRRMAAPGRCRQFPPVHRSPSVGVAPEQVARPDSTPSRAAIRTPGTPSPQPPGPPQLEVTHAVASLPSPTPPINDHRSHLRRSPQVAGLQPASNRRR